MKRVIGIAAVSALAAAAATAEARQPAPPARVLLSASSEGMEIRWQKSLDDAWIDSYEVVRGRNVAGPFVTVCIVPRGTFSCVDATADVEWIYFYKVRAVGTGGASRFSREAAGELQGPADSVLQQPAPPEDE